MSIPNFCLLNSFLYYIFLCACRAGQKPTIRQRRKIIENKGFYSLTPQNSVKNQKSPERKKKHELQKVRTAKKPGCKKVRTAKNPDRKKHEPQKSGAKNAPLYNLRYESFGFSRAFNSARNNFCPSFQFSPKQFLSELSTQPEVI